MAWHRPLQVLATATDDVTQEQAVVHPSLMGHQSGDLGEGLLTLITGEASLPSPVLLLLVWYQQVPAGACARS